MKIGISYDVIRWEEKDLLQAIRRYGSTPVPIYLKDFHLTTEERLEDSPDLIVQRSVSHKRAQLSTLVFEGMGLSVVNPSTTLLLCQNKLHTTIQLSVNKISTPRTGIAFDETSALKLASKIGYPVVLKPIEGSWGRMTAKALDEDTLRSLLEYQRYTNTYYNNAFYLQEFVKKPDRDIRVFVIGDEAPVGIYRVNERNWRTNTALGARAEPLKVDEELEDLALRVREVVGGHFLGVDIFEDKERGYLVNEVNAVPEYKNTVRVTGFDVSGKLVSKLTEVIKR